MQCHLAKAETDLEWERYSVFFWPLGSLPAPSNCLFQNLNILKPGFSTQKSSDVTSADSVQYFTLKESQRDIDDTAKQILTASKNLTDLKQANQSVGRLTLGLSQSVFKMLMLI